MTRLSRRSLIAAVTGAVAVVAVPRPAFASALDTAVDTAPLDAAIAGLPNAEASGALAQVRMPGAAWVGGSGQLTVRNTRPPTPDCRFRIGSMTKVFTAVVVLQLAAAGRIDLDAPVQRYLPDVLPPSYDPIPVRSLLNWTSGLNHVDVDSKDPDWFFAHRYDHWEPGSQLDVTKPLRFTPGQAQYYGNIDYIVAGMLIERVTGQTWATQVHRRIIEPLRLTGTFTPGDDPRIPGPHAHGYQATDDGWVDVTEANPSLQWSAASIISTLGDLDRFVVALFRGRLLPAAQLEEMFTVPDVPLFGSSSRAIYAAGLQRSVIGGVTVWSKSGDRPGYVSAIAATRDLSVRLVYCVNTLQMGQDEMPEVAQRIVGATVEVAL